MAFSEFVDRHESALLSFAAAFLRDETQAQDVVQEAFLRAARDPQRLLKNQDNHASGRNWLLKVVRDLSVDSLRKKASERRALTFKADIVAGGVVAAEDIDETQDRLQKARDAIDRLRPRLREIMILKVREKKSYKEIAEITGLTATNVGFLLHQAMQELQKDLRVKQPFPSPLGGEGRRASCIGSRGEG